jgi:hypothetical protein
MSGAVASQSPGRGRLSLAQRVERRRDGVEKFVQIAVIGLEEQQPVTTSPAA